MYPGFLLKIHRHLEGNCYFNSKIVRDRWVGSDVTSSQQDRVKRCLLHRWQKWPIGPHDGNRVTTMATSNCPRFPTIWLQTPKSVSGPELLRFLYRLHRIAKARYIQNVHKSVTICIIWALFVEHKMLFVQPHTHIHTPTHTHTVRSILGRWR